MPRFRTQLFVLATFLLVFPFFLKRRPRVERRISINKKPEEIFAFLEDLRNWPLWTAWSRREAMQVSYGEVTRGAGATQQWRTQGMEGTVRIIRSEPDQRLDYEVDMGGCRLRGRFDLLEDGACTRVAWRCVWDPALNPYLRYRDLFLRVMLGRDFSEGLTYLKELVEDPLPDSDSPELS